MISHCPKISRHPHSHIAVRALLLCCMGLAALQGCSEALPRQRPEEEFGYAMNTAEKAAQEAAKHAASARVEVARSEQLLAEAKLLEARLRGAEQRCEEQLKQAIAMEKSQQKMFKLNASRERERARKAAQEAADRAAKEAEEKLRKAAEPEYSPSDAPVH